MTKKKKLKKKAKLTSDTATTAEKNSPQKMPESKSVPSAEKAKASPPTSEVQALRNEVANSQNRLAQIENTLGRLVPMMSAIAQKVAPQTAENPVGGTPATTVRVQPKSTAALPGGLDINTLVGTLGPSIIKAFTGGTSEPAEDPFTKQMREGFQNMWQTAFLQFIKTYDTKAQIGDAVLKQINTGKLRFEQGE